MSVGAFYFQKDSLLLPPGTMAISSAQDMEIPLDYAAEFPFSDIFDIPALARSPTGPSAPADDQIGAISCVSVPPGAPLPPLWQAIPVRQTLATLPDSILGRPGQISRVLRAYHIAQWRKESLFCGKCGGKTTDSPDELARLCPACGHLEYPRIAPAVITLIINDEEKALLAHNRKFATDVYSLIAGFVEAGENLEAAVARETREETGIEIRDIEYAVSQPWPFPNSLMMGFTARYASGTVAADGIELDDARWFGRDELPRLPGPGSVSLYLIERWLEEEIPGNRHQVTGYR